MFSKAAAEAGITLTEMSFTAGAGIHRGAVGLDQSEGDENQQIAFGGFAAFGLEQSADQGNITHIQRASPPTPHITQSGHILWMLSRKFGTS